MSARIPRLAAALAATVLAFSMVTSTPVDATPKPKSQHQKVVEFWTNDKVRDAKPRDIVRDPTTGKFTVMKGKPGGGGSVVLGSSWNGGGAVLKTTGKVLFQLPDGYYVCSASVANDTNSGRSVILTAAHCVYDQATHSFATMWMFIPDYDSAAVDLDKEGTFCASTSLGCWTADALVAHRGFTSQPGFNTASTRYDFAFAVVGAGGKNSTQLDATVGSQPVSFDKAMLGTTAYLFGYPAAKPYTGKDLIYTVGTLRTDPQNANGTYRVASTLNGGSSGGPWFDPFTAASGTGTMMSLNSYGYGDSYIQGPFFNGNTQAVYTAALSAATNTVVG